MPLARQPTQRTTLPLLEPMQRTALPNKGVGHSRTKRAAGPRLGGPFLLAGHTGYLATSRARRSEEHTSELQSLMRISYAVFCLKKKKTNMNQKMRRTYIDAKVQSTNN